MSKTKPIPISRAKAIAQLFGYEQIVILGRKTGEDGMEHVTTFGIDKEHCEIAAKTGNYLKYHIMGWVKPFEDAEKEGNKSDLIFLKEMKSYFDKVTEDLTSKDALGKMIDDWIDELTHKEPK